MTDKNKKVLKSILRYSILIIILLVLALLIWWFFSTREKVTYQNPVSPVVVTKAENVIINNEITLSSYIEAEAMIPVVPFVNGTIIEYNPVAGERVEENDIVAKLDPEPYKLQVSQAEAAYKVYLSTYERLLNLSKNGAATEQQLEEVKAQKDAGEAQLDLAKLQLDYATVKSPVSGTYILAPQAVGDIGNTSSPLAVIADLDNLIVNISVPERYFSLVANNDKLKVSVTRPASSVSEEVTSDTTIISITPFIDPRTKTFNLKVKLKNNIEEFTPGMYVKATILLDQKECLALPIKARKLDGSVYSITEEIKDDKTITIATYNSFPSLLSDSSYFEIPSEYKETKFILKGQNSILPGQEVNIIEETK